VTADIIARLNNWFSESLHISVPSPDTDLLESGLVDSLQIVELLMQLEEQFGFKISIDDIDLDDLRSLERIAALVAAHAPRAIQPRSGPDSAPALAATHSATPAGGRPEIGLGDGMTPMQQLAAQFK